jgi:hypothetical protein
MNTWEALIISIPPTIASIASLVVALKTNRGMDGLLDARVHAAKAEGQVKEQGAQLLRDATLKENGK